tara:strand:+ start:319 stop:456 length:138 start_codon:yes stop_codon:yes gene_type:complete
MTGKAITGLLPKGEFTKMAAIAQKGAARDWLLVSPVSMAMGDSPG